VDFGLFPDARGTERNGQKRENQAQNRPGSGEGEVRKFPHEATRTRGSTRERTRKIPNSDELGICIWWSWGELNPRPQALHRQFYILSCVVMFNLRPRQRANIAQASYLRSRDMLSNPTSHISRVYDAAMACAIHPTGEVVQRPAGLSG